MTTTTQDRGSRSRDRLAANADRASSVNPPDLLRRRRIPRGLAVRALAILDAPGDDADLRRSLEGVVVTTEEQWESGAAKVAPSLPAWVLRRLLALALREVARCHEYMGHVARVGECLAELDPDDSAAGDGTTDATSVGDGQSGRHAGCAGAEEAPTHAA